MLLKNIGSRALERDTIKHRPLICYALHPDVMSEEEYNFLTLNYKPSEWLSTKYYNYRAGGYNEKMYVAGILVFLIRLFFEKSNGRKSRSVWGLNPDQHLTLIDMIGVCAFDTWGGDYGFPAKNSSDLQEWLRFQCWVLKCGEKEEEEAKDTKSNRKGGTSCRLKNNERIYKLYRRPSCEDVLNASAKEQLSSEWKRDGESEEYIVSLLSSNWKEYLLSLSAIVAEDEVIPDTDEWRWLQELRNIEVKRNKRTLVTAKWVLTPDQHNGNDLWLELVPTWTNVAPKDRKYVLKQGENNMECSAKCTAEKVISEGFDIMSNIEIYRKNSKKKDSYIEPIQIDDFMFFRDVKNLKKERCLSTIEHEDPYAKSIIILHRDDIQSVEVSRESKEGGRNVKEECEMLVDGKELKGIKGLMYSKYALPLWNSDKQRVKPSSIPKYVDLLINGRKYLSLETEKFTLPDREGGRLVVHDLETNEKIQHVFIQRETVKIEFLGSYSPIRTSHEEIKLRIPMVGEERSLKWGVPVSLYWQKHDIMFYETEKYFNPDARTEGFQPERVVSFIMLPKNWRDECEHATDWIRRVSRDRVETWINKEKGLKIESSVNPNSPLIWWWKFDNGVKEESINAEEANENDVLQIYSHVDVEYALYIKWSDGDKCVSLDAGWSKEYSMKSLLRRIAAKKRKGRYTVVLRRKSGEQEGVKEEYVVLEGEMK